MNSEIIEKYGEPIELIGPTEAKYILGKFLFVHRLLIDLMMFEALLLRYGENQRIDWLVYLLLRNPQVLPILGILGFTNSFGGKNSFIEIDDPIVIPFEVSDLLFQIQTPPLIFLLFFRVNGLDKFYRFFLDLMLAVKLS